MVLVSVLGAPEQFRGWFRGLWGGSGGTRVALGSLGQFWGHQGDSGSFGDLLGAVLVVPGWLWGLRGGLLRWFWWYWVGSGGFGAVLVVLVWFTGASGRF